MGMMDRAIKIAAPAICPQKGTSSVALPTTAWGDTANAWYTWSTARPNPTAKTAMVVR